MSLEHLEIVGTGSYLPCEVVGTDEFVGREKWAYGIYERRRSSADEWPSDMGYVASQRALERAGVSPKDLVGIIVATVSERINFPSAAVKIQLRLGAENVCIAYDLQNACAGYPVALMTANALSRDFPGYWLAVASEVLTKINDPTDINSHLFGDGAGAAVLHSTRENKGILKCYSESKPFEGMSEMIFRGQNPDCIRMPNGRAVFKKAVGSLVGSVMSLKKDLKWERADVYIPHQANERIIAEVERRLSEDGAIVYRNVAKYGNMSAATCAVALDEAIRDGTIGEGNRVILTSFGAGLVTSAVALQF